MRWVELMEVFNRVHRRMVRQLSPVFQEEGLSGMEMMVLWKVAKKGPWKITDLAGFLGIPPSTLTGILDRLENRGLIRRTPDPDDRRSTLVEGTPLLCALLDRVVDQLERKLDLLLAGLPEKDYSRLIEALTLLDRYLYCREGNRSDLAEF
ncbi:MAG: MarR family winged helix-turn-helix transcriptional regulator [Moorellaceae bacterium]